MQLNKVVYYGLDYSALRINDPKQVALRNKIKSAYVPAWMRYVNRKMRAEYKLGKMFRPRAYAYNYTSVQLEAFNMSDNMFVNDDYSLSVDQLSKMVSAYNLSESAGVGFVIIPEYFKQEGAESSAYVNFVFFDIQTKEVLWGAKMDGLAGGMGYTNYWGRAVYNAFCNFRGLIYKEELKAYKRNQRTKFS